MQREQRLLSLFQGLSPTQQTTVLDFIEFLSSKSAHPAPAPKANLSGFRETPPPNGEEKEPHKQG